MKRREAREKAIQTLFQLDGIALTIEEAMNYVVEDQEHPFYENLVRGTIDNLTAIDQSLVENLENWSLERLPKIERTVLRLAVFELNYNHDEVPASVVLNEAIELCKTFGDEKSGRFVNGVLSKFTKQ